MLSIHGLQPTYSENLLSSKCLQRDGDASVVILEKEK